jgi:hypothetical protein
VKSEGNNSGAARFAEIRDSLEANLERVDELMRFDEIMQDMYIKGLAKVDTWLEKNEKITNQYARLRQEIQLLKNIRRNDSAAKHYQVMLNQCVVLLVSYFESALEDLFEEALRLRLTSGKIGNIGEQEFKVKVKELVDVGNNLAGLVVAKKEKELSFQDMQSIGRAFNEYVEVGEIPQSEGVNNIIAAQAYRHAIIHNGGMVSTKTVGQMKLAVPRKIKTKVVTGEPIQFDEAEILVIRKAMQAYFDDMVSRISAVLSK